MRQGVESGEGTNRRGASSRALWLEQHVLPHEPWLRRKLAKGGVPADHVEDVIQDAYLRLLHAEDVTQVRHARSYLSQVAVSVVLSQVRRAGVVDEEACEVDFFAALPSPQPGPDREVEGKQEFDRVWAALQDLGDRSRSVIILRRLRGFTSRQTAERMRLSESAIEKHLRRATRRLAVARLAAQ